MPPSPTHPQGWVDSALLWEIFYSILLCYHVLDYSVEDLRLHHLGVSAATLVPNMPNPPNEKGGC